MHNQHNYIKALLWIFFLAFCQITDVVQYGIDNANTHFVYIVWLLLAVIFSGTITASKEADISFAVRWAMYPLLFVLFTLIGYARRKKLRWLSKHWFIVSLNQLWKFMKTPD